MKRPRTLRLDSVKRWAGTAARSVDVRVCAALGALSTGLAVVFLQLWAWRPSVPLGTSGDFTLVGMIVKGLQENGGYLENPSLGWPLGLHLYDLPIGDDGLNLLLMRIIGWFAPNFAAVMWIFVLITFPLVSMCAYVVIRRLGCSILPSVMVGLLYTFLNYHFRGQAFLLLIGYYAMPFALLLAVRVFQGVPLFARRDGVAGLRGWLSRRTIATVVTCLVIGSTGLYLAAFAVVVLVAAGVVQLFSRSTRGAGLSAFVAIGLVVAMIAVNTSPSIVYRLEHGANPQIAVRGEHESEIYGLTLTRMVIPPLTHRFGPAKRFGEHYQETTALPLAGEESSYIGVVGVAGLAGLLVFAIGSMTRGSTASRRRRYGPLAAGAGVAFVFGIVGGANTIFSYVAFPVLRGTGRISVAIGFLALAAVALALDGLRARLARRRIKTWVFPAVVLGVIGIGLYDQTATAYTPSYYRAVDVQWDAMGRFVDRIEASVPKNTAVYTLPEQQFPESPGPGDLLDYDSAIGYLHSKNLKWSYGAARGRQGRWLLSMSNLGLRRKLERVSACGFGGIWLDRSGYPPDPESVSVQLRALTGTEPMSSEEGRWEFFSLARYNQRSLERELAGERSRLCALATEPGSAEIHD